MSSIFMDECGMNATVELGFATCSDSPVYRGGPGCCAGAAGGRK
jgi:hypothetical protein